MKKLLVSLLVALPLLHACTNTPPAEPQFSETETILGNLHRVENARVGVAYMDPDADFSVYSKVLLDPLDLSKTEIVQPSSSSIASRRPWVLNETNTTNLQRAFSEVFTRELAETGDYQIVDSPGPDVLRITASVTQLAPNAAPDDNRSRTAGRTRVYSEGAGSMSITFGFSDSDTRRVLAVVRDARRGSPMWGPNNSVTNMSDVRNMFGRWARMVRARLDIAHGY